MDRSLAYGKDWAHACGSVAGKLADIMPGRWVRYLLELC